MAGFPPVRYEVVKMAGGLDLVTPTLNLQPGVCRAALNFECAPTGGYTRIGGYERFDGRPAPSSAQALVLAISRLATPTLGSVVTGVLSGASGVLVAQALTSFVLTKVSGAFTEGEALLVAGAQVATLVRLSGADTQKALAQYKAAAANAYRDDITAPPGSGPALGAFCFDDVVYAFRNSEDGLSAGLWRSSPAGWVAVPLGEELAFTGASAPPDEGSTVTQGAVSAVVLRVVLQSGAYAGGTAAGKLIIGERTGGDFTAGAFTAGFAATCSGAQSAITLAPNGKYQFEQANFAGSASTVRVYGCDGKNRAFEFDGEVFVPIDTGTSPDAPAFLAVHKKHLMLAIGSSLVHSAPGLPYDFTAISGAAEIATGDTITGFLVQPGAQTTAALAVFQRSNTLVLYGTGTADWNLVPLNTGTGAIPYTAQNMAQSYVLDDRGVFQMATTLNYGNFAQATLTASIRPFLISKRSKAVASVLCREKSQYRLYFSDGSGLHLTVVNGQFLGAMPIFYPINRGQSQAGLHNAWSGTLANGDEILLGCGTDGFVYRLDKGTSFDGENIEFSLTTNFASINSPRVIKRYRKLALEMGGLSYSEAASYAEIRFAYLPGYGNSMRYAPADGADYATDTTSPKFDDPAVRWDSFFWDGSGVSPTECEMVGSAENVALVFSGASDSFESFTINSAIIHYSLRRGLR